MPAFQFGRRTRDRTSKNKYKAVKTGGFASKFEYAVHAILLKRMLAGEISDIKCQQTVVLIPGPPGHRVAWKVDFSFMKDGERQFAEAKGFETQDYKIKLKLWRHAPPYALEIWKGSYVKPKLVETIQLKVREE